MSKEIAIGPHVPQNVPFVSVQTTGLFRFNTVAKPLVLNRYMHFFQVVTSGKFYIRIETVPSAQNVKAAEYGGKSWQATEYTSCGLCHIKMARLLLHQFYGEPAKFELKRVPRQKNVYELVPIPKIRVK